MPANQLRLAMMSSHFLVTLAIAVLAASSSIAAGPSRPVSRGCDHGTAFHNAVANRQLSEVKRLVSEGADLNARATGYYKNAVPLQLAIKAVSSSCQPQRPDAELFAYLLSVGADIRQRWPINLAGGDEQNALHSASEVGSLAIVELALNAGISANDRTIRGRTALLIAVENKREDIVEHLLKAGADPNIAGPDRQGSTRTVPLHLTIRSRSPENRLAKTLVSYGAKCPPEDTRAFALFVFYEGSIEDASELVDLLLKAGCSLNHNQPGPTPLNLYVIYPKMSRELVELVLKKGADPNRRRTLYALAGRQDAPNATLKRKDILELLFKHGARIELTPQEGIVPLLEYAQQKNPEYARELLETAERFREQR
jgi:uncharacterized protein